MPPPPYDVDYSYDSYDKNDEKPSPPPSPSSLVCTTTPAPVCAGDGEDCFYDPTCDQGGLGCNAGGKGQRCRFCGFGDLSACPEPEVVQTPSGLSSAEQTNATVELIGGGVAAVLLLALVLFASRRGRPAHSARRVFLASATPCLSPDLPRCPTAATAYAALAAKQAFDTGLRQLRLREGIWIGTRLEAAHGNSDHRRPCWAPGSSHARLTHGG